MNWRIPSEYEKHNRTWVAWPWDGSIWNRIPDTSLERVQKVIVDLVLLISKYEDVALLVPEDFDPHNHGHQLSHTETHFRIEFIRAEYNDIWVRDTLPTFALNGTGGLVAVDWRFNGWGRRSHDVNKDVELARYVAALAGATVVKSGVTAEGGAFAFDGNGLLVATKSVMRDRRRNREADLASLERSLLNASHCSSICWLPGDRSEPVTIGHADGILAFGPGNLVFFHWVDKASPDYDVCQRNLKAFEQWAAACRRQYEIVLLVAPNHRYGEFWCSAYVNFAVVNGAIIVPTLGGEFASENQAVRSRIDAAFHGKRNVEMLDISGIAAAGGGIHCVTCNEPAAASAK